MTRARAAGSGPGRVATRVVVAALCVFVAGGCDEAGTLPAGFDTISNVDVIDDGAQVEDSAQVQDTAQAGDSTTPDAEPGDTSDTGGAADVVAPEDTRADADADPVEVIEPDPTELEPTLGLEPGRKTTLVTGDVTWVARLDAERVCLVRDGRIEVLSPSGAVALGPVPEAGLRAAALLPQGRLLLSAGDSLLVEDAQGGEPGEVADGGPDGSAFVPSPLREAFDGPVLALTRSGSDLWLSTATELARLSGTELRTISSPSLSFASEHLVPGPSPTGSGTGLWLATDSGVVALAVDGSRLSAFSMAPEVATSLAVDAQGRVWAVVDGVVYRRVPAARNDNTWVRIELPSPVIEVLALPTTPHVWLVTANTILHEVNDNWAIVTAPLDAARKHTIDPAGTLLRATGAGLVALSPGRLMSLSGLQPNALLERSTAIDVRVSDPDLATVTTRVDGVEVSNALTGEGPNRVFRVVLDPEPLARGPHILTVDIHYTDDDTRLSAALPFEVMHITWVDEVAPIYEKRCATCHNEVAGASTAVLATPDDWAERYDCILCRVTHPLDPNSAECRACEDFASPMPPFGKLSDTDLDHLRRWRSDGFREE